MQITKTLYVKNRQEWRKWLKKNHKKAKDIWLVYYNKASGKPRIPYNDAVEEALCFGWIDSTVKNLDKDSSLQRFSPRRKGSVLSEMNKERMRRLVKSGKMTKAGLDAVSHHDGFLTEKFVIPDWILKEMKKDKQVWKAFRDFPDGYKRIRIGYIRDTGAIRREAGRKRLAYFIKMTKAGKKFGMVQ